MPLYDVFLSHASADKPDVERLAHKLKAAGITPFLDIWHLVPGERWIPGLGEALAQSRAMAVFIGSESRGGAWQDREVEVALVREAKERKSFRIIPVLLPRADQSADEGLRQFLELFTWVDFRNGLDNEDAFHRLVAGIRGESLEPGGGVERPPLPYRCMAPPQELFVQRSEYAEVRDALLTGGSARGTTVGITTAIHGAGGFGKTALATELCYDERIRERFPDGAVWVQMRDNLDDDRRLKEIRDVLRRWTQSEPPAFETVVKAGQHLVELLHDRKVLLVVDDVWHSADLSPFRGLSPTAALLVTTRDSQTLPREAVAVRVDTMEMPEAVRLLGTGLPAGAEAELKTLAALLGEWPLLLNIVNRQVASWISKGLDLREAIHRAENALKARGLTYFDPKDAKERSQASALTLEVSLERLSPEEQKQFTELAIFPEDTNVPLAILEKLWQLDPLDVEELASRLFDLSLLRNFDLRSGTIRLHDVIRAYLLKKGESYLPEWHQRLLDACRPASGRWPDLPRDERYLWNYLIHHLIGAGQSDVCRALLLDFHYLDSKLRAADINAVLADYSFFVENDQELRLVRDALQLSAHILARNPVQLREQLWGRLLDPREAGIRGLVLASEGLGTHWLRPRKASLSRPGGALIRTIDHPGLPSALAVLHDGCVVSGSADGTLRVWDVESGQILHTLEGHSSWVNAVAVLDSRRMVSGSSDGTLRVWDVENSQVLQVLKGHSGWVRALTVLDSRRIVSGSNDKTLRVWNVESGQALEILKEHSAGFSALTVLNSGRVVSGSDNGIIRVWDLEDGQVLQVLEGHSDRVCAVVVLDSGRIISGSDDKTLRVWDVESSQALQVLEGHSGRVRSVAVLDSGRVVSSSNDGTIRVWNLEGSQVLQILEGHSQWVHSVVVLDSSRVISGSDDMTLRVWDVESSQVLQNLERHSGGVRAVAVLDSGRVVAGYDDGTSRVWDVENSRVFQVLKGHSAGVRAVAALDSGRIVSGSEDGTLRVWDVESGQTLQLLEGHSFKGHYSPVRSVAVLDSDRVISGSDDRTLRVWDVESGQTLQVFKGHFYPVRSVAVLDIGRVISGSDDRRLKVWDVESGQTLQVLEGHSNWIRAVAVLDSGRVVSGSDDGTLRVWDVESGQTLQLLEGHSNWIRAVAVLDSRRVVSGSDDGTLRVWDVESGKFECLFTLDASVTAVAVIPDRRIIVAGDGSGRVHFFDFVEPPSPG
jgi:WD40 repeat protein